jgi:hypothetical protein
MKASRTGVVVSALPGLLALGLFYSLAIHMRRALGGWPTGIGEAGFPPSLVAHANIAAYYIAITLTVSFFTLPVAILTCLLVPRWRRFVRYFALYAFVFLVCMLLTQLAPEPFLYWWRD